MKLLPMILIVIIITIWTIFLPRLILSDRLSMNPLPEYVEYFNEILECIPFEKIKTSSYTNIKWFSASKIKFPNGDFGLGVVVHPNEITIRTDVIENQYVIKHELIHYIMQNISEDLIEFDQCI